MSTLNQPPSSAPYAPLPSEPQQSPRPERKERKTAATWGLALGIVALCGSPIPILNNAAAIAGLVGVVFGVVALFGRHRVMATFGVLLAIAGIWIAIALQISWARSLSQLGTQLNAPAGPALPLTATPQNVSGTTGGDTFTYEVMSNAPVRVTYLSAGTGGGLQDSNDVVSVPWTKNFTPSTAFFAPSLFVMSNPNFDLSGDHSGDSVSCTVKRNGTVVSHQEAHGPYATVSCS